MLFLSYNIRCRVFKMIYINYVNSVLNKKRRDKYKYESVMLFIFVFRF